MSNYGLYPTLPSSSPKNQGDVVKENSCPLLNDYERAASPRKVLSSLPELLYRNTNCEDICSCNSQAIFLNDFASPKVAAATGYSRDVGDQVPAVVQYSMREIETAKSVVDNISYNLHHDVKSVFQELGARLQHTICKCIEEQCRIHQGEINKLQHELARKQRALDEQTILVAKKEEAIQSLEEERIKMENCKKLGEWKLQDVNDSLKKFKEHIADMECNHKLVKRVFNTLLRHAIAGRKARCEAEFSKRAETISRRMEETFANEKSQLETKVKGLQKDKEQLQREMGEFESAVQQALMRGLCSLNMEALKVIKNRVDLDHIHCTSSCENQHAIFEEQLTAREPKNVLKQPINNEGINVQPSTSPNVDTGCNEERQERPKAVVTRHYSPTAKGTNLHHSLLMHHHHQHSSSTKHSHLPTRRTGSRFEKKPVTLHAFRKNV